MLLLPLLLGCSHSYSPDQRAKVSALSAEFEESCDRGNEYEQAQNTNCDFTDYDRVYPDGVLPAEDAQAEKDCESSRTERIARINAAPSRTLQAIVADRNALGLTQWQGASWICDSRMDALADSKGATEEGAHISNGYWY